jgi:hypothetical protein
LSSCDDWSDDEWEGARDRASAIVATLHEADGHAAHIDWPANGGTVVAFNGWTEVRDHVLSAVAAIAGLAPDSYGEIVLFPVALPNDPASERLLVRSGKLLAARGVQA